MALSTLAVTLLERMLDGNRVYVHIQPAAFKREASSELLSRLNEIHDDMVILGHIIDVSNAHGIQFAVRDKGTGHIGWYEPHELTLRPG
jgi:hypothetical protein